MDCELAVGWAVRNAAIFGGDPSKVTIMGQSSGATMVWGLMAHKRTATTFQRAIALSGSPKVSMHTRIASMRSDHLRVTHTGVTHLRVTHTEVDWLGW
jgi:carboxylesterase type B